ncbi:L-lactate permease, partial [Lacrimispora saccharolytica]|nr:L-lactate permease [Lacrimispora saccharolytica]
LAAAWDALAMSAGLTQGTGVYLMTAFWTATFIWFWNAVSGFAVCWFYGKGKAIKKGFPAILLLSAIQGGGELLLSQINSTLSCFVPACVSLIAIL